ncbi:hypothetical protein PR202_gb02251 [Eleusine coracana subsp. coracana]|uniref:Transcription factor FAMA n=1 Tax=Eleusine coracana subsp. coracana TaxID=191504 RepID=A0AAV5DYU8_ELECO|nr:hypothetical protein PR202_gb02251 [Eleusine coracana subsp. coracana]
MIDNHSQQQHGHLDSFAPLEEHHQPAAAAGEMVDYMLGGHHHSGTTDLGGHQHQNNQEEMSSFDKLSFSDVLQFADFGPKLALNNQPAAASEDDDDDSYLLLQQQQQNHVLDQQEQECSKTTIIDGGISESTTLVQQQQPDHNNKGQQHQQGDKNNNNSKQSGRRKRPRTVKTTEEVESQRMTHIAVERNRRRQMNEYLRVLRSLMPGSYVQRGDQASIIGGAIEFIRELEQLIQCLESQKRRRLYGGSGDTPRPVVDAAGAAAAPPPPASIVQQPPQPFLPPPSLPFPTDDDASGGDKMVDLDGGLREEVAENKSCLADIEVRALGADAMIKILSRRRPGQLIKTIAALEEMQMNILHTNITTIEQTVLYSFNVKIAGDARFSAEDIAGAVHQILSFIDINYTM